MEFGIEFQISALLLNLSTTTSLFPSEATETGWLNFKGPPVVLNPKSESIMSADSVCPKVVLEEAVAFV